MTVGRKRRRISGYVTGRCESATQRVHIDGSTHQLNDDRWYELIVTLVCTTSKNTPNSLDNNTDAATTVRVDSSCK
jgi:hypothetical protein